MNRRIKYGDPGNESTSIIKGGFVFSQEIEGKGPSNDTGFYAIAEPAPDGWAIFTPGSPSPRERVAANDSELLFLIGKIGGDNTSVENAIAWCESNDVLILAGENKTSANYYKQSSGTFNEFPAGSTIFKITPDPILQPFSFTIKPEFDYLASNPQFIAELDFSFHQFLFQAAQNAFFGNSDFNASNFTQEFIGYFFAGFTISEIKINVAFTNSSDESGSYIEKLFWSYSGMYRFNQQRNGWYKITYDSVEAQYPGSIIYLGPPAIYKARFPFWDGFSSSFTGYTPFRQVLGDDSGSSQEYAGGDWYIALKHDGIGQSDLDYRTVYYTNQQELGYNTHEILEWGDTPFRSIIIDSSALSGPILINHDWTKLGFLNIQYLVELAIAYYDNYNYQMGFNFYEHAPTDNEIISILNNWAIQSQQLFQISAQVAIKVTNPNYIYTSAEDAINTLSNFGMSIQLFQ